MRSWGTQGIQCFIHLDDGFSISEKKIAKAKFKAQDLLGKSVKGDSVSVGQLASFVGLIISFFLAMGGITRFRTSCDVSPSC